MHCVTLHAYACVWRGYARARKLTQLAIARANRAGEAIRDIIPAIANTHRRSRYNGGRVIGITIHLPPPCRRKDSIIAFRRYFLGLDSWPPPFSSFSCVVTSPRDVHRYESLVEDVSIILNEKADEESRSDVPLRLFQVFSTRDNS